MKTLTALLTLLMALGTLNVYSQEFEVPEDYVLVAKEDYSKYEKDMIEASKWLVNTPMTEQMSKRNAISTFVFKWVNGSPTVNVELNETIMDFDKKNPGMLIIYMAACAQYVLENNYSKDMRAKHKAGVTAMATVYKSGKGISKDKKMEKLVKAIDEGTLDEWLDKNLKVGAR